VGNLVKQPRYTTSPEDGDVNLLHVRGIFIAVQDVRRVSTNCTFREEE
jgi:hypothetical protein